jgi:hypothetical protein
MIISNLKVIFPGNIRSLPVGDIRLLFRDRIVAVPCGSVIIPSLNKQAIKIGLANGGLKFYPVIR